MSLPKKTRKPRLVFVGGSKGGTGKTVFALAMIDYLRTLGIELIIIETDSSNSDVYLCYEKEAAATPPTAILFTFDFTKREEWLSLMDLCQANPSATIVINTKGGNSDEVEKYGPMLNEVLPDIPHELVTTWVLNLYRDSVSALSRFHQVVPGSKIHAILNEFWGHAEDYDVYNGDPISKKIAGDPAKGIEALGSTQVFPEVANRILRGFFNDRRSLEQQVKSPQTGTSAEVRRWRRACVPVFERVLA